MTHPRTDAATFFITNAKNAPPECILTTIERNSSATLADDASMLNKTLTKAVLTTADDPLELTNIFASQQ